MNKLGLIAGLSLLIWQCISSLSEVLNKGFQQFDSRNLLPALFLALLSTALQIFVWQRIMKGLGIHLSLGSAFQNYAISFIPRYIPGTVWGYLSRAEWLARDYQTPYRITNTGSLLELCVSIIGNLFIVSLLYIPARFLLPTFLGFLLVSLLLIKIIRTVFNFAQNKFWSSFGPFTINSLDWIGMVIIWIIIWFLQGISFLFTFRTLFPIDVNLPTLLNLSGTYGFAWLVGFLIIFIPAGLGLREATLSSLLLASHSLTISQANGVAVFFRLVLAFSELIWIAVGLLLKAKKHSLHKSSNPKS